MSDDTKVHAEPSLGESDSQVIRGELDQVKCIAKGGMAYIFRARQPALDRYIVVKKLKDELMNNPEMLERFRREAKALAAVLHQNVAHVYDFVDANRESYIVMEYIDGIDLSTVVSKVGNIPPKVAACILLGVARGVSYIHTHNLIHRDIKPSNIRITNRGLVKLMDFGIVMDIDSDGLTRPGIMVGSPSYLSPEQVVADPISARSDQFLLGIVLYEMLTGTRPFKDESGTTVFQKIREAKYVPVKEMQSNVPTALVNIVRRLLQKNPDKRYPGVKELIAELETFLGARYSARSEDVILEYLDGEALVNAAVPYESMGKPETFNWKDPVLWKRIGAGAVAILVGALIGYFIAGGGTSADGSAAQFPATKTHRK